MIVIPAYQSQHLIELSVPLALFTALGIEWVTAFRPGLQATLALGIAVVLTAAGLHYVFVQYVPVPALADLPSAKNDTMTEVGYFVKRVRIDATIYMFDDGPLNYAASPQAAWLAGDRTDVVDILPTAPQPSLQLGPSGGIFLFLPRFAGNLATVRTEFPGGRQSALFGRYIPHQPLALVYTVGHPLKGR
jgi:hypothetical protein